MNRYKLTDEVRKKYLPIIKEHTEKIRNCNLEEMDRYDVSLNLSDTGLNPYTLGKLLEELGYEKVDVDKNGWEMDFWITYEKSGCPPIQVRGTGITFELFLSGCEEDDYKYADDDKALDKEDDEDYENFISDCMKILNECDELIKE